ncbi:MAG TPA: TetR family transcriptional regulator [Solirubrobacteraceae bacterium]|nr:TetR family transcriptional regulator [Solirubrobacteraceae bacterium]
MAGAIVQAAATVLAERGDASMSDVAGAAGVARATLYRYFPSREALLEALGSAAVEEAGQGLAAARLDEVAIDEAFARAVRALVVVGDYFVVLARERATVAPKEFDQRVGGVLGALIERGRSLGEIREDVPVGWLVEALIGVIVSVLGAGSSAGAEDKVDAITSLFLDGARRTSA